MIDYPPDSIGGRFSVLEIKDRGATGTVYRGFDTTNDEYVAIKLIRPDVAADDPSAVGRFKNEAQILRELDHPGIARFVAMIEEGGQLYLITEFVPRGSLKELLAKRTRLSLRRVVQISFDIADALAYAHELGIIHRDIKPANVLFAEDWTPRLTDFGIAFGIGTGSLVGTSEATLNNHVSSRERNERVGTPAYMSPEAYRGEIVGPESDIWSLGMVMFEMLTGILPFEQERAEGFVAAETTRPLPSITSIRSGISDTLAALIRRMLEIDRYRRVSKASDIRNSLGTILYSLETDQIPDDRKTTDTSPFRGLSGLPEFTIPFVGRRMEYSKIEQAFRHHQQKLISVIGPGGVGKSRLAVETVSNLEGLFRDGCYFIPLASVSSADYLVSAIANALGFSFQGFRKPKDQLLDLLRERQILLVLDNFEHLQEGRGLLLDILNAAPNAKLLVTSRSRLDLNGEFIVAVAGLPLITERTEYAGKSEAAELFRVCAERVKPDFSPSKTDGTAIERICRLVEGVPLGIELAAVWVGSLSCERIAGEIENNLDFLAASRSQGTERHRSLRAVFDHSWQLLHEAEKRAFRKLSVFRGGLSVDGAKKVAGASPVMLSRLVEKFLLRKDETDRFDLHEILRQFAEEELSGHPYEMNEVETLHAHYYSEYLRRRAPELACGSREALLQIDDEIENIRAAWQGALARGDPEEISTYFNGFLFYHQNRALFHEGEQLFEDAVRFLEREGMSASGINRQYGAALSNLSSFQYRLGRMQEAVDTAQEALVRLASFERNPETAQAYSILGLVERDMGRLDDATFHLERALAIYRETGERRGEAICLCNLGHVAVQAGELDKAQRLQERAVDLFRAVGHRAGVATALNNLATYAYREADFNGAMALFLESLALARELEHKGNIARTLNNLGLLSQKLERFDDAMAYYEESLTLRKHIGDRVGLAHTLTNQAGVYAAKGELDVAKKRLHEALRIQKETGSIYNIPVTLLDLARVTQDQGEYAESEVHIRDALRSAKGAKSIGNVMKAIMAIGQLFIEIDSKEDAFEIALVVLKTPEMESELKEHVQAMISWLERELAPNTVSSIRSKVEDESLENLAERLLQSDWGVDEKYAKPEGSPHTKY